MIPDKFERTKFFKNCLKPLSKKKLVKYDFVGFDIETYGKTNKFLMGGVYYYTKELKEPIYKDFWNKEELIEELLSHKHKGKYIIATNLDFDLTNTFWKTPYWNDLIRIERGSNIISAEYKSHNYKKKGKTRFLDTTNYVFWSVEKLGKLIGVNKLEKPSCWIPIRDDKGKIRRYDILKPRNEEEREELIKYNMYDCKISCDFMYFLQSAFNKAGGNLKMTIASSSFDIWRRNFLKQLLVKEDYILKTNVRDFIFKGYYGGRTETFKRGLFKEKLYYYDINSLYPSVMKDKLYPLPQSVKKPMYFSNKYFSFEGVSEITVRCPSNLNKPFLPYRDKKTNKLCFPQGEFKGVFNHCEIRKAVSLGYEILKIHNQIYYTKLFKPFNEFVDYFYNKRLECKNNNDIMELPYKLILNSLYGKFGMKKITKSFILNIKEMKREEIIKVLKENEDVRSNDDFTLLTYKKDFSYNGKCSFPIIASYVTSYARILMYDYINSEQVIYTDTDSIITEEDLNINSKELGKMKFEGVFDSGFMLRPKAYLLRSEKETIVKAKGVSKCSLVDFEELINGQEVNKFKLSKLRESIKRRIEPFSEINVPKKLNLNDNKRKWKNINLDINSNEDSIPLIVGVDL